MQTKSKIRFDIKFHTNLQFFFFNLVHFLLVHAGNVWMTTAITYQSIFSTQTSFRVAYFPLALQPHFVKPWPSHIEASLTACLREISVSS
jgi:hypothetical protein